MPEKKLDRRKKRTGLFLCLCATAFLCACKNEPAPISTEKPVATAVLTVREQIPTEAPVTSSAGQPVDLFAVTPPPTLTPEPVPTPTATPVPATPAPTLSPARLNNEKYCAPEGVYTVAWISDTQHYANTFPEIYPTITSFLAEHAGDLNLTYVVHTGDLVHRVGSRENWERAVEAMDILGDIPYGVLAGNHDEAKTKGIFDNYCRYFGEDKFSGRSWYGDSFEDNRGHYDLITVGDTDYIFVYMSFEPDEKALRFIKESFDRYPDRVGILCLHDFIKTDGTISADGKIIREKVLAACPNCYLVLCGHRYGFYCLEDTYTDDGRETPRTVYEMMMNYQAAGKEGGSGYFRLMQFDDAEGTIRILSYSAYLDDYNWLDDPGNREPRYTMDASSEEFTLKMPWRQ